MATIWTAQTVNGNVSLTADQLATFRQAYVSSPDLASRMSNLFWFDLYVYDREFGVSPHEVLREINSLEKGTSDTGTKPPTLFNFPPLKGLWHKHFFSAHFLVNNLLLALGKNGLEKLAKDEIGKKGAQITDEILNALARRVANEPVDKRANDGKLTGEWIVFAKHQGKNYYLCLNTHDAGDQAIYNRIMEHCAKDFPQLSTWFG